MNYEMAWLRYKNYVDYPVAETTDEAK
jgi:hypothetical protein